MHAPVYGRRVNSPSEEHGLERQERASLVVKERDSRLLEVIVSGDRRFVEYLLRDLAVALGFPVHAKPRNRIDRVNVNQNRIELWLKVRRETMKQRTRYAECEAGI